MNINSCNKDPTQLSVCVLLGHPNGEKFQYENMSRSAIYFDIWSWRANKNTKINLLLKHCRFMNIRERLKSAYENVAYGADRTWSNEFYALQKLNLDLYTKESQLQQQINVDLRPRTVRDCIPNSKLAKYSNYEYNDSRELSYTANDFRQAPSLFFTDEFKNYAEKEPWMLEEVDSFYKWYTIYQMNVYKQESVQNDTCKSNGVLYEPPFFRINSLSEYLLKLQLSKDAVRKLWDVRNYDSKSFMYRSLQSIRGEKSLIVYKSPGGQFFVSEYDDLTKELKEDYYEWFKDDFDYQNDLDHLNILSNTFKKQTEKNEDQLLENPTDPSHQRRLYSAVLQGFSSNKIAPQTNEGQMTILRRNVNRNDKNTNEKLGGISELGKKKIDEGVAKQEYNTVLDKNDYKLSNLYVTKSVQTTTSINEVGINSTILSTASKANSYNCHQDTSFQNRFYSNNTFLPNIAPVIPNQPLTARYRQNFLPNNYHYPSFYMFIQNSFQQQPPFYNPLLLQRTVPASYERTIPQRTLHLPVAPQYIVPTSNYVSQSQYAPSTFQRFDNQVFKPKVKTKVEVLPNKRMRLGNAVPPSSNIKKNNDYSSCSSFKTGLVMSSNASSQDPPLVNHEIDDLVSRTVDLVLEDGKAEKILPVSGSMSEELERQALEQYNSDDNVYQELERQAAEEYENSSENCKNPPNCRFLFGGFLNQCRILICYG